jgi:uncharacterized membrane protein
VTGILLVFVIPQFEELFKGFGADLPAFTQFVVNMSRSVRSQGYSYVVVIGGALATFMYFKKRSRKFRENLDRISLKIPVIGEILTKSALARFARTLSTMFAAGVNLVPHGYCRVSGGAHSHCSPHTVNLQRTYVSRGKCGCRRLTNRSLKAECGPKTGASWFAYRWRHAFSCVLHCGNLRREQETRPIPGDVRSPEKFSQAL